jgi:hypothetical protein
MTVDEIFALLRAAVAEWLASIGDANTVKLEQRETRIYSRLVALQASVRRWERVKTRPIDDGFDYIAAAKARAAADRIRGYPRAAIIDRGRDLLAAKAAIPHGHFTAWVKAECRISVKEANKAMRAARLALLAEIARDSEVTGFPPADRG